MKKLLFSLFVISYSLLPAQTTNINVVFHVVWKTPVQNIPDSCLQQQLDVLNEDYNAANADLWKVPSAWVLIIGNMNVHFQLATTDPNGNPTTGIERYQTTVTSFSTNNNVCHSSTGGMDAWPDSSYLNIWVCNLGSGLLGYAQFPGGNPSTDGAVLHYGVTGRGSYCMAPYDHGRVGTHEIAHWFGLKHLYADPGCADVDGIADTPPYMNTSVYGSFPPFTVLTDACNPSSPGIMWMNFMTAVDDSSMYFFTQGQVDTMTWVMNNMRLGSTVTNVRENVALQTIRIYPSPSTDGHFSFARTNSYPRLNVNVFDANGKLVAQLPEIPENVSRSEFDLSSLAEGIYSVLLISDDSQQVIRVSILR